MYYTFIFLNVVPGVAVVSQEVNSRVHSSRRSAASVGSASSVRRSNRSVHVSLLPGLLRGLDGAGVSASVRHDRGAGARHAVAARVLARVWSLSRHHVLHNGLLLPRHPRPVRPAGRTAQAHQRCT